MLRENSRGKGLVPEIVSRGFGEEQRCCNTLLLTWCSVPFSGHFSLEFVTLLIFPKRQVR
jgi:hypothetical protein